MSHSPTMPRRAEPATFGKLELAVDNTRHIALYVQLAGIFRHKVVSRAWVAGQRLPNFETLAEQFRVARITVRQAVALLVQEGLLTSTRGRGTFVCDVAQRPEAAVSRAMDAMSPEAADLRIRILSKGSAATMPREYAGEHASFDAYAEITKVHLHDGQPFAVVHVFVAAEVFREFPKRAIEKRKILRMVMNGDPRHARCLEQTMTVEPADFVLSEHLAYPFGSPVARILRRVVDDQGRLSYAGVAWYRGDLFVMRTTLPRALVLEHPPSLIAPTSRKPGKPGSRG